MKTYPHLAENRRVPSPYEIVSSKLLYYPDKGFEVETPLAAWYAKYQQGSPLVCSDWERFADPAETTYAAYTRRRHDTERHIERSLAALDAKAHDAELHREWVATLDGVLAPLRYACHGLHMLAAYIGSMAPSGRLVICAAFQAADEMRRVHWLAYRMRLLQMSHEGFGGTARAAWENDPRWQPMREVVEHLLTTYEWGEAFVAVDRVFKPVFDAVLTTELAECARRRSDAITATILETLGVDCSWHEDWSAAAIDAAVTDTPTNVATIDAWENEWRPRADAAVEPLRRTLENRYASGPNAHTHSEERP